MRLKKERKEKKTSATSTPLVYLIAIPAMILSGIGAVIYWLTKKPAKR